MYFKFDINLFLSLLNDDNDEQTIKSMILGFYIIWKMKDVIAEG